MAQWIALGVTILGLIMTGAVLWGRMTERVDNVEVRVATLERYIQTPAERNALAETFDIRFKSHEHLDDIRFANLQQSIDQKLEMILAAITRNE